MCAFLPTHRWTLGSPPFRQQVELKPAICPASNFARPYFLSSSQLPIIDMLPEEILADSFAYLSRVELVSTVYPVSRLFHEVSDLHPSVRSVLRLGQVVTRSKVTRVDAERISAAGEDRECLFLYARPANDHYTTAMVDNNDSYATAVRSPSEVPSLLVPHLCFGKAYINHYDVTPTTVGILRQLAPSLSESYLIYDWYHPSSTAARTTTESEATSPPIITYNEISTLLFDQLLPLFSHGEELHLAGYCIQRTTSSFPPDLPPSTSLAPASLFSLPEVLRRHCIRLTLAHSRHEPPRRRAFDVLPPGGEHVLVGADQLVDFHIGHIFNWLHHDWHRPKHRSLRITLLGVIVDLHPLEQLIEACKEVGVLSALLLNLESICASLALPLPQQCFIHGSERLSVHLRHPPLCRLQPSTTVYEPGTLASYAPV